ncbi:MAG: hypothetical protein QXK24_00090 [Ignisphaera sp.]
MSEVNVPSDVQETPRTIIKKDPETKATEMWILMEPALTELATEIVKLCRYFFIQGFKEGAKYITE